MARWTARVAAALVALGIVLGLGWLTMHRLAEQQQVESRVERRTKPVPVEVEPVAVGPIELRRTFSGTLEAPSEFVVAPKVEGRVRRLNVRLADTVTRGQVIAELDDEEFQQAVARAEAELAVADAGLIQAQNTLNVSQRQLERTLTLHERGAVTDGQVDLAHSERAARQATVHIREAEVSRAKAELEAARIRLSYTTVRAHWNGEEDEVRFVAERFIEEGDPVSVNTPLISVVDLDPILAVVYVTERDYGSLRIGQKISLSTDAFSNERFEGEVIRVAPVFRLASRQARVEISVANPGLRLKPGMFVRAEAVLDRVDDALIVPIDALVNRSGSTMLFVVDEDEMSVMLRAVDIGIQHGPRVQVTGQHITGRVVTLGHQMLDDGTSIVIPDDSVSAEAQAGEPADPSAGVAAR